MNKKTMAVGVFCAFASAQVFAQSSVTLYGIIDAGLTYVSNIGGAHAYLFDDGVSYGNRVGFMGTEDLGGGNKAVFKLENGFRLGNGRLNQGGALFGRQAYVGLANDWGTLTLGNQYDFAFDFTAANNVSAFGSGYGVHLGDFDRQSGDRLSNSIKFVSNSFHGLVVGGMYSFSNTAGDFRDGSSWSVGSTYNLGNFSVAGNYTRLNSPTGLAGLDPYAQIGVTSMLGQTVATVNPATGAVIDSYSSTPFKVDSQSIFGIGANYVFGKLTVNGDFSNTTFKGYGQSSTMRVYETGVQYQATTPLSLIAGYQYTTFEGHHWHEVALGTHYLLSKNTDVYAAVDWMRASEGVDAVIGYSFTPSLSRNQTAARLGMRHNF
ncbi:Outer membrane porin protein [Paraburkholderia aspalathi]|uniref:Outer membrane porin protein n=1 Tax=Paraburkholderia aspalathi TaxID=1324617 RepID=A0ABM8T5C2_9BURK|nr:porin [Paraburkholderia aspalathi]MBK3823856.1 porin [Paraburkholderia aspalathi]MBK3835699.1 porin [Paraburkholderia aspalathi]MBK3865475.1 porin [Paraburkholderia aspalathi]CAE6859458.1 Outer membrane porin protein [Paraburkholderia aspalathi]